MMNSGLSVPSCTSAGATLSFPHTAARYARAAGGTLGSSKPGDSDLKGAAQGPSLCGHGTGTRAAPSVLLQAPGSGEGLVMR